MSQIKKEIALMNKDFANFKSIDYHNFIIISIGTGSAKIEQKFSADLASKWGSSAVAVSWWFDPLDRQLLSRKRRCG